MSDGRSTQDEVRKARRMKVGSRGRVAMSRSVCWTCGRLVLSVE